MIFVKAEEKQEHIDAVYTILEECGKDMYEKKGLTHWLKPYPKENIIRDIREKHVFLIKDEETDKFVATITFTIDGDSVYGGKGAVIPSCARKGIGRLFMKYMEEFALEQGIYLVKCDVYDKSQHAIDFVTASGYKKVGEKNTTNFKVFLMEKHLNKGE